MAVLNHHIVAASNRDATALFFSDALGLDSPVGFGPFAVLKVGPDTTLDFVETEGQIHQQHYAFLVSEEEFDKSFRWIRDHDLRYWSDPLRQEAGTINYWDDGRGVYFDDPNGHLLEIITRPYGSGGTKAAAPHPLVASALPVPSGREETRGDSRKEGAGQVQASTSGPHEAGSSSWTTPVERMYFAWNDALSHNDVEGLVELYATDAHFESPLVSHLLGTESGVLHGREELRALFEQLAQRKPPVRQYHRSGYLTDGKRLVFEYPREAGQGEQMDFVESMELDDEGMIQRHCVYWGWFGVGVLQRDEYRRMPA